MHDALCVLTSTIKNKKTVYGGGHTEMVMAKACENIAKFITGKEALAIEAFAKALRQIPVILCNNGGYDSQEIVQQLKVEIQKGSKTAGIDMYNGKVGDMKDLGVTGCYRVKEQALMSAFEAAQMILRVDNIIRCAPRQRRRGPC